MISSETAAEPPKTLTLSIEAAFAFRTSVAGAACSSDFPTSIITLLRLPQSAPPVSASAKSSPEAIETLLYPRPFSAHHVATFAEVS